MKTAYSIVVAIALMGCNGYATAAEFKRTSQIIKHIAPKGISNAFYACIDDSKTNKIATAACLKDEERAQQARLNDSYNKLLEKLGREGKVQLVTTQQAWMKFRDEEEDLQSHIYGRELIDDLEMLQNDIFKLCDRANSLERYAIIANDR